MAAYFKYERPLFLHCLVVTVFFLMLLFFVQSFLFLQQEKQRQLNRTRQIVRLVERFEDNIVVCIKANISVFFYRKITIC
jgi:hypothetical protein